MEKECNRHKSAIKGLVNKVIDMGAIRIAYKDTLDHNIVNEMIHDDDISIYMNSVIRDCKTRNWSIDSEDAEDSKQKEINNRLKKITNFNQWVEETCNAFEYGYVAHEVEFDSEWNICRLNRIPYSSYSYDYGKKAWALYSGKTFEELSDNGEAYIILSVYNRTYEYQKGQSILVDIYRDWLFMKEIDAKMKAIVDKYGDIITFFGYDATWSLDDEGKKNIESQAEMVAEMSKNDVIGVPMTDMAPKLSDNIYHITLDQLKTETHTEIMDRLSRKIALYYMGATGHMEAGSNRAESEVHQEEKEKVVNERVDFIEEAYNQILYIDAFNFGYNYEEYFLRGDKERDLAAEADLDKKVNENRKLISETLNNLNNSGKTIEDEELAKMLDIPLDQLSDYIPPETTTTTEPVEFAKDDVEGKVQALEELKDQLSEKSITIEDEITQDLSEQIQLQLEELKSPNALLKDMPYFNIDTTSLSNANEVASLLAYYDATFLHDLTDEYVELNPFKLSFEEAVNAYSDVESLMIERFEEHLSENVVDYNAYIKRNTDYEVSRRISEHLEQNLKKGQTFKKWKENVDEILSKTGTSPKGYHLKMVYRNNIQTSYNSAQQQEQRDTQDFFPYLEYVGIDDKRQSEICRILDGMVRRANDPIWNKYYPLNHHLCRSGVISMTTEEMKNKYGKVTRITKEIKELELGDFNKSPLTTDYKSKLKKKEKSWEQQKISLEKELEG